MKLTDRAAGKKTPTKPDGDWLTVKEMIADEYKSRGAIKSKTFFRERIDRFRLLGILEERKTSRLDGLGSAHDVIEYRVRDKK